jgi:hypothetical protein
LSECGKLFWKSVTFLPLHHGTGRCSSIWSGCRQTTRQAGRQAGKQAGTIAESLLGGSARKRDFERLMPHITTQWTPFKQIGQFKILMQGISKGKKDTQTISLTSKKCVYFETGCTARFPTKYVVLFLLLSPPPSSSSSSSSWTPESIPSMSVNYVGGGRGKRGEGGCLRSISRVPLSGHSGKQEGDSQP